jgi:aminoglycoside phosphotransferase family enzyme
MADDIFCLDEGPAILDCLDFAERYRCGDVLLDAAFLVMDLERLGRPDLGRSFLDSWRGLLGERYPDSLAHHYIAYRAHVRAKVACLRAEQGLQRATATARQLHDLAERHLQAARIRLVLIGGAPGTGKTSLAQGLSDATGGCCCARMWPERS